MYLKLPSSCLIGSNVEFFDHWAANLRIASLSSSVTSYRAWNAAVVATGTAATVVVKPNNLVYPIPCIGFTTVPSAKVTVSFISLSARLTILVPVLAISAGKDTKLPIGNFLKPCTNSDT